MAPTEWDPDKARNNQSKHGLSFADAVTALEDDRALTIEDEHPDEGRFITLGKDCKGRLLVVVYTYRGENIRIISTRRATAIETHTYEAE